MFRSFMSAAVLWACLAGPVSAAVLLSADDARARAFPSATAWEAVPAAALATARRALSRDPQVTLSAANFIVWRAMDGDALLGYFVTDQVIGKFEKIDYATSLDAEGRVREVQVLAYRESHGHEVAEPAWLAQFTGRDAASPLKAGRDVDGITGATLSVVHLSEGIRRVTRLVPLLQAAGY